MSDTVISVENLSKQYRLGQIGRGSLSQDVNRWWHIVRGKDDPYLKIGEENDRTKKGESEYVWALRDINFEVKQGQVLGIIGRNGAGKSTLLKILSKVTAPTTGVIKSKGRIASLLEVGTGFHPDLSGRDNIFLNGAILGMTKKEIRHKFDEIVDFSGVERYVDTPVKRYSSGMYVRLAFAVAAHLEPEILIVDEVLAVGDAEFQKKCLGKMKDVSEKDGRTVLFVSHNMSSIEKLCGFGLFFENGILHKHSNIHNVIEAYFNSGFKDRQNEYKGNGVIKSVKLFFNESGLRYNSPLKIEVAFKSGIPIKNSVLGIVIKDLYNIPLIGVNNKHYTKIKLHAESIQEGRIIAEFPKLKLLPAEYKIDVYLGDSVTDIEKIEDAILFSVEESPVSETATLLDYRLNKVFMEDVKWQLKN